MCFLSARRAEGPEGGPINLTFVRSFSGKIDLKDFSKFLQLVQRPRGTKSYRSI